ncbi:hypothetical protein BURPS406E_G0635 [Burkholderia pseudomallei 406e]|uniref:Uncharacterized protein n=1 Tax=Burkholderia pseudomallei 1710a TaxID=320371 RepID=A0A0E1VWY1_BURPE|nr:hypothetical protein BMASAVP1_0025 [Burkholderia mallei SAVP1]EDO87189.1 hypothetical protein BURPS406E_G0635 [Burkholderia pseudomallei 406e]EDO93541.1 hypothetical protein BURPSPAST_J0832 [Burkholderia pseudomallei Pasteur 52237]EET04521.1 hypothetical protein BURPS1710A_A0650 [Burkholderia pseudomallei 1710a]
MTPINGRPHRDGSRAPTGADSLPIDPNLRDRPCRRPTVACGPAVAARVSWRRRAGYRP